MFLALTTGSMRYASSLYIYKHFSIFYGDVLLCFSENMPFLSFEDPKGLCYDGIVNSYVRIVMPKYVFLLANFQKKECANITSEKKYILVQLLYVSIPIWVLS